MNKTPAAKVTQLSLKIIHRTIKNKNHNSAALISILVPPLSEGSADEDEESCKKLSVTFSCGADTRVQDKQSTVTILFICNDCIGLHVLPKYTASVCRFSNDLPFSTALQLLLLMYFSLLNASKVQTYQNEIDVTH